MEDYTFELEQKCLSLKRKLAKLRKQGLNKHEKMKKYQQEVAFIDAKCTKIRNEINRIEEELRIEKQEALQQAQQVQEAQQE